MTGVLGLEEMGVILMSGKWKYIDQRPKKYIVGIKERRYMLGGKSLDKDL